MSISAPISRRASASPRSEAAPSVARYAIYFAPGPRSALGRFGTRWLGRDAERGRAVPHLAVPGIPEPLLAAITAEPRRYGFHGTLKPPFALAAGRSEGELRQALADFAARRCRFRAPPLRLKAIGSFLALTLSEESAAVAGLAEGCVRAFEEFRSPARPDEVERRRAAGLSPRQEALLAHWGYPYVLDEFRFHLTVTGRLDRETRGMIAERLAPVVAPLCGQRFSIDGIALFAQPDRRTPFRLLARYRFGQAVADPRDPLLPP